MGSRYPRPDVHSSAANGSNSPVPDCPVSAEERGEADVRLATSIPSSIISVQNALVLEELCAILKERIRATELSADRISCKSTRDVTRGRWFIERQGDLGGQSAPRRVFQNE